MVVDDDTVTLDMLRIALGGEPYESEFREHGIDAVLAYFEAIKDRRPFDVLVLDCALPRFDGFRIARIVRATERGEAVQTRLVFFTAFDRTVESSRLLEEVGADGYVRKPDDVTELSRIIAEQLAHAADPSTELASDNKASSTSTR